VSEEVARHRHVVAERLHQDVASSDAFIELDAGLRGLDLVALNEGDATRPPPGPPPRAPRHPRPRSA
jgi:hypothetical protein